MSAPAPEAAVHAIAKAIHYDVFNADHGGWSACSCENPDEHAAKLDAARDRAAEALDAALTVCHARIAELERVIDEMLPAFYREFIAGEETHGVHYRPGDPARWRAISDGGERR